MYPFYRSSSGSATGRTALAAAFRGGRGSVTHASGSAAGAPIARLLPLHKQRKAKRRTALFRFNRLFVWVRFEAAAHDGMHTVRKMIAAILVAMQLHL